MSAGYVIVSDNEVYGIEPNDNPYPTIEAAEETAATFERPAEVYALIRDARAESLLGYTVVAERPSYRNVGDTDREVVGFVHPEREPADNHQAYCQAKADQDEKRYGVVTYRVVAVYATGDVA